MILRYWDLDIYLKLYIISYFVDLFNPNFQCKKWYLGQSEWERESSIKWHGIWVTRSLLFSSCKPLFLDNKWKKSGCVLKRCLLLKLFLNCLGASFSLWILPVCIRILQIYQLNSLLPAGPEFVTCVCTGTIADQLTFLSEKWINMLPEPPLAAVVNSSTGSRLAWQKCDDSVKLWWAGNAG